MLGGSDMITAKMEQVVDLIADSPLEGAVFCELVSEMLRLEMRAELKSVLSEAGTTTIYVTHDQTEAVGLADRIAVLHAGRIQQIGAPAEVYAFPATTFAQLSVRC
jgi:ABC-type proline/glycine betaine transport system ATPase subunit